MYLVVSMPFISQRFPLLWQKLFRVQSSGFKVYGADSWRRRRRRRRRYSYSSDTIDL